MAIIERITEPPAGFTPEGREIAPETLPYLQPERMKDIDFADFSVLPADLSPDGKFYAYSTQSLRNGELVRMQIAKSENGLTDWQILDVDGLSVSPKWADTNPDSQGIIDICWAPHVSFNQDTQQIEIYYATRAKSGKMAISKMTSDRPDSGFIDVSESPLASARKSDHYSRVIDPFKWDLRQSVGREFLVMGSAEYPIQYRPIDGHKWKNLMLPTRSMPYGRMLEAPFIFDMEMNDGTTHTYMFLSGDNTFGNGIPPFWSPEAGFGGYAVIGAEIHFHKNGRISADWLNNPIIAEGNQRVKNIGQAEVHKVGDKYVMYAAGIDRYNPYQEGTDYLNKRQFYYCFLDEQNGQPTIQNGLFEGNRDISFWRVPRKPGLNY